MTRPSPLLLPLLALAATPAAAQWRADISRDTWGIAHVRGRTDADAVFGMMYAQAEDDFPRIERNYLVALGRLAEAEGEGALWQDLRQRLFLDHDALRADYARSPAWLKRLTQAWAGGLNRYLADHPETRPRVLTRFEPWMALSFTEGSIGGDIERVPLSQLEAFYGRRRVAWTADERGLAYREPQGSNGMAIAPARTRDGRALLLINPHTSFFFRSEAQVTSGEGLDAYGAATWGQFFVYQGFNRTAGWMHTSSGVDSVDEFAEVVDRRALTYRYGTETRALTVRRPVTIAVRGRDGRLERRTFTTYHSHHGPIVREADGRWIAFALMNRPIPALEQSFLRTKARDYAAFLRVAGRQANSSNATLFADARGTIAYLHPQFVPLRDDRLDYTKPVDGSDPATDWRGLHTLASLPQAVNPRTGWAMNTNNWPWTAAGPDSPKRDAFPRYMDMAGENPRGPHAEMVLNATPRFTPDLLLAAAYDPTLTFFADAVPRLLAAQARAPRAALREAAALLSGWDYRWGLQSVPTSLAVFWGEALWPRISGKARAAGVSVWDYATTRADDDDLLDALGEAAARLRADFGRLAVPWGEINRYQRNDGAITQTFDDAKPSIGVPFTASQWGSLAAFGARRYQGTKRMDGTVGNSFVAVVEFGRTVRARAVSVGGESGDPASPHFADQAGLYAAGRMREVWFAPADLKGHVARRYAVGGR